MKVFEILDFYEDKIKNELNKIKFEIKKMREKNSVNRELKDIFESSKIKSDFFK